MKQNVFILFILLQVVGFTSCVVDDAEVKPDFTRAGKEMFLLAENNLNAITDHFDVVLKLNQYIQTPDSLKEAFKNEYFEDYFLNYSEQNKAWFLESQRNYNYYVVVDSLAVTTPEAHWTINSDFYFPFDVVCKSQNEWEISYSYYDSELERDIVTNLNITCKDVVSPGSYKTGNFKVSGRFSLTDGNYFKTVMVSDSIVEPLVHEPNTNYNFSSGIHSLSAFESDSQRSAFATAEYVSTNNQSRVIKITMNDKFKLYTDL